MTFTRNAHIFKNFSFVVLEVRGIYLIERFHETPNHPHDMMRTRIRLTK